MQGRVADGLDVISTKAAAVARLASASGPASPSLLHQPSAAPSKPSSHTQQAASSNGQEHTDLDPQPTVSSPETSCDGNGAAAAEASAEAAAPSAGLRAHNGEDGVAADPDQASGVSNPLPSLPPTSPGNV